MTEKIYNKESLFCPRLACLLATSLPFIIYVFMDNGNFSHTINPMIANLFFICAIVWLLFAFPVLILLKGQILILTASTNRLPLNAYIKGLYLFWLAGATIGGFAAINATTPSEMQIANIILMLFGTCIVLAAWPKRREITLTTVTEDL